MTSPLHIPIIVSIGTFPPTDEGIATFNSDLVNSMQMLLGESVESKVIAVNLSKTSPYYFDTKVIGEIDQETLATYKSAAEEINRSERIRCVILHHEYGIFGGRWGNYITEFIEKIDKPLLTVMHTVLNPDAYKDELFTDITGKIVARSDAITVLSRKSKILLSQSFPESVGKTIFIPHGIHPVIFSTPKKHKKQLNLSDKKVLTTFGLLSRTKGIEYILSALPAVVKKYPNVLYQVVGQTHPIIRRKEGERYRIKLTNLVKKLNLRKHVRFIDKYLDLPDLIKILQATDIYISTSINKDQSVSGTFSYALGVGRAVVSTKFTQSQELIKNSIGRLVDAKDSPAFAQAINELLGYRFINSMHRRAYQKTRSMLWTNVAKNYIRVCEVITSMKFSLPAVKLDHLDKMTAQYGILQFSQFSIPQKSSGYTLDDNARAAIALGRLMSANNLSDAKVNKLFLKYFRFVKKAQQDNGIFINYFDSLLNPTQQNKKENPQEHYARAIWMLAEIITNPGVSESIRKQAKKMWNRSFGVVDDFKKHLRPRAFIIKAAAFMYLNEKNSENFKRIIISYADDLVEFYKQNSTKNWDWFENKITYNNAILPESLLIAYKVTKKANYLKVAKKTFHFLIKSTFMGELFVPIGQKGWYPKGKKRSYFDQQPEDVSSMISGLLTFYEISENEKFLNYAYNAYTWFIGNNLTGLPLYNHKTGAVYDGLTNEGVNKNQGAESLVSYLLARLFLNKYNDALNNIVSPFSEEKVMAIKDTKTFPVRSQNRITRANGVAVWGSYYGF